MLSGVGLLYSSPVSILLRKLLLDDDDDDDDDTSSRCCLLIHCYINVFIIVVLHDGADVWLYKIFIEPVM